MRHPVFLALCLSGTVALTGCGQRQSDAEVQRAIKSVNVIDESNLNDIMLTVGDPDEAVAYFQKASTEQPDRIDLKRGLGKSLVRANRPDEAVLVWSAITASPEVTARLGDMGVYPRQDSVAGARGFFVQQQAAMKRLVNELGVVPQ